MRPITVFGVYLALLAPAVPAAWAQDTTLPPLEEQKVEENQSLKALRQVQSYMDGTQTLEAEFRQEAPNGNIATGRLYLERPGYVRFDYTDETPFLIVADGKTLNFVDYEIGQVTKWPLKKTPLRALLGGSVDLASLQAHIEMGRPGFEKMIMLSARDPENPEQGEITLHFIPDDGMPTGLRLIGWTVLDAKGEVTQLTLTDQQVNGALDDALWTFEDPRGLTKRRRTRR